MPRAPGSIVLTPWQTQASIDDAEQVFRAQKEKGHMLAHVAFSLLLVPLTGIELVTFALRMRSSVYIDVLISISEIWKYYKIQ
ncbi:hypothetical protein [Massilia sp. LC238]|uniref:hypothetical protein n=1 Tax=Massilia sp. LC238 TaxID=1502852 RepID=UPI00126A35E8|nr:hypothetical protein [Massilia sp. LC238]